MNLTRQNERWNIRVYLCGDKTSDIPQTSLLSRWFLDQIKLHAFSVNSVKFHQMLSKLLMVVEICASITY